MVACGLLLAALAVSYPDVDSAPCRIVGESSLSAPSDEKSRPLLTVVSRQITIPTKAYSQKRVGGPSPTTTSPAADTEANIYTDEGNVLAKLETGKLVVGDSTEGRLSNQLGHPPTSARARGESV
jgi:hypothetical protein